MLLIRNFEVVKTPEDRVTALRHLTQGRPVAAMYSESEHYTPQMTYEEVCKGRHFVTRDGEDIVLAVPEKDQKLIGVLYEAFDGLSDTVDKLHHKNRKLEQKIEQLRDKNNSEKKCNKHVIDRLSSQLKDHTRESSKLKRRIKKLESIILQMTEEKYD